MGDARATGHWHRCPSGDQQADSSPDIFIAIFWTRLGTPTPRASSGTAEEIATAVTAWERDPAVEVLTYFNTAAASPDSLDHDQLGRLKRFRERIQAQGFLTHNFSGTNHFEAIVREHLGAAVRSWPTSTTVRTRGSIGNYEFEGPKIPLGLLETVRERWAELQVAALGDRPFDVNYINGVVGSLSNLRGPLLDLFERASLCTPEQAEQWHQWWDELPGMLEKARPWIEDER